MDLGDAGTEAAVVASASFTPRFFSATANSSPGASLHSIPLRRPVRLAFGAFARRGLDHIELFDAAAEAALVECAAEQLLVHPLQLVNVNVRPIKCTGNDE